MVKQQYCRNCKEGGLTIQHKIQDYQKTRIHNYKIETVFMKLKDRIYDFRGFNILKILTIFKCFLGAKYQP
ncbi:MAG: hypothetical protein KKA79_03465 [Nanoarchaeota archaeon]|nr:hypothetical protein [Nanoarchaeota archaeon]